MLDIDFGTYPFVTSSSTTVGGVCTGLGIPPKKIGTIIGVMKAYTTRVGGGPFPSEQLNVRAWFHFRNTYPSRIRWRFKDIGVHLQEVGREWGVTTGRRRRCGWLDLVVMKHSCLINGYDVLNLTKLDVLDDLAEIKVAVKYMLDGKELDGFPGMSAREQISPLSCAQALCVADLELLSKVEVVYVVLPGWKTSIASVKTYSELPENCQKYVVFIEQFLGVQIEWIGVGPGRQSMLKKEVK